MPFEKLPDGKGMVYVPEEAESERKHPCPDCFSCQWCGDQRCRSCRKKACRPGRKCHEQSAAEATDIIVD